MMRRAFAFLSLLLVAAAGIGGWLAYRSGDQAPIDIVAKAETELGIDLDSSMVPVSGVRLHVVQAGPPDGAPVILLHGYPEFWWAWHKQIPELAKAGFRVIVPDQRGYNASDKPAGVPPYQMQHRIRDVLNLMKALGHESVYLAGHDMGAAVAWYVAIEHPDAVRKLVVFNVGHPLAYQEAESSKPEQETISWYRTFFQIPLIPEIVAPMDNWGLLVKNMRATSRPGTFSDDEMNVYRYAWYRDNAMHSMINWYRASYRYPARADTPGRVKPPTKVIWGKLDAFSESRLAEMSVKYCSNAEAVVLPDVGHWLLHEEPLVTSRLMIDFFKKAAGPPAAHP
jgi:pimeloyl-ACP methyl ester carboxylesterase